jgi:serine/threonine protein kinase
MDWEREEAMSNMAREELASSGVQFGKYQVCAKLATGGMAELFIAKQQGVAGISKTVVIKCVLPHLAQSNDFLEMFLDEARVATMLQHPNIVQIFEVGQVHDVYYIAMEYIRGTDLKRLRKQLYSDESFRKDIPYGLFAGIIAQAAAGLHYAHNAMDENGNPLHIIHRDVSPNNLLVSFNGTVKIVDFGVAKATTQEHRTRAGMLKGRLSYMSPEQISGLPVTPSSDVFALGIVLYELSTNQRLFKRQNEAETVQAVIKHPIPLPTQIIPNYPPALEKIVMRALDRDTATRYPTAEEMRLDLEAFMRDHGYFGATQIAKVLDQHFGEEKRQSNTGILPNPFNHADLQYLAYRTGQFGSHSNTGSHPQAIPEAPRKPEAFSSGSGASSFGYFQGDEEGVKGVVFEPSKSRATIVFILLLVMVTGVGLAVANWNSLRGLFVSPPPQPDPRAVATPPLDREKQQALIAQHQNKINDFLVAKAYRKALAHLQSLQISPEGKLLDEWIKESRQLVNLESSLATVSFLYQQKSLEDAEKLIKKLMLEYHNSERVREWFTRIQEAKKTGEIDKKATEKPKPVEQPIARTRRPAPRARKARPRQRKVAMRQAQPTPPREEPKQPAVVEMGRLFATSTPTGRLELDGELIGYTPINGKRIKAGSYTLRVSRPGHITATRQIEIKPDHTTELEIRLLPKEAPAPRPVAPQPPPRRETAPPAETQSPTAAYPFSKVNLPRTQRLRLLITDSRGLVANQYTEEHTKLATRIEEEAARLLGSNFTVKGVTRSWQEHVRDEANQNSTAQKTFYPRAVAFVIYKNILLGRSQSRVAQLLVLYERKNRFRSVREK